MDLSSRMPSSQDASQSDRMEARRESMAAPTGGDGPEQAPQTDISQTTSQGTSWENDSAKGTDWETADRKSDSGWETTDRKG